jgi:hypothetical protein
MTYHYGKKCKVATLKKNTLASWKTVDKDMADFEAFLRAHI